MKPERRFKLLKYTLIVFSLVRLCIGLLMALLAIDHLTSAHYGPYSIEVMNQTSVTADEHSSSTSFDIIMNDTDRNTMNPVRPDAALIASISVIILSVIGLIGLLKDHIIWIVSFGLLSLLFLILRVHALIRYMISGTCESYESCIRDELVNTVIGVIEILMISRLAYELRLRRNVNSVGHTENAFPDLRTSVPTVMNVSEEVDEKIQTDVEEIETSLTSKKHQTPSAGNESESTDERRRSSARSFSNTCRISNSDWT